jgi:hypothetical protein
MTELLSSDYDLLIRPRKSPAEPTHFAFPFKQMDQITGQFPSAHSLP